MSAELATPSLLETKVFWNKDYDFIICVHDVTNKILSGDSNYIVDVVIWPKFANSVREVITPSTLYVCKIFQKINISYPPDTHTHVCVSGVRNVSFLENFAYELNEWFLITTLIL